MYGNANPINAFDATDYINHIPGSSGAGARLSGSSDIDPSELLRT